MTATILHWPRHQLAHCTNKECIGCHLCHGGLALCLRCNGYEGGMPSDCPGEQMTSDQADDVYEGRTDWRRGEGWVSEPSKYSPAAYKTDRS